MSKIEWTGETWNPTLGCSKVSPGCDGCYAIGVAHRGMTETHRGLTIKRPGERLDWTGEVRLLDDRLDVPLRRKKPTTWFVDSMSDLFHSDVPAGFVAEVFGVMAACRWTFEPACHTFQVLTKRPQRMAHLLRDPDWWREVWANEDRRTNLPIDRSHTVAPYSLPNVWLGTSIESDRYAFRADHLRATPAAVRFLSLEPLLGPLPSLDLTGIGWVIVGGESGPGARPMHPDWVHDIRDRCVAAGIPFFFKQWGEWGPSWRVDPVRASATRFVDLDGNVHPIRIEGLAPSGWCGMNRAGKRAAGRQLDGRTWDEMPAVAR